MKKNSRKKDILKPEVGDYYKLYPRDGLKPYNIIQVTRIVDNIAFYTSMYNQYEERWDFGLWPEILSYKLTKLEVELL